MAKILVSMDDRLLARVDREARKGGLSRSAYLARLAAGALAMTRGPGRKAAVRRTLERLDRLFAAQGTDQDATAAIRAERDLR
ncbi:MAG: ribbon-helix-helix protein, CopG family [Acidobacteria bacterium]|nr:ribbon-helix-helix protein, CopG family [Acidobacteriota bacterium]